MLTCCRQWDSNGIHPLLHSDPGCRSTQIQPSAPPMPTLIWQFRFPPLLNAMESLPKPFRKELVNKIKARTSWPQSSWDSCFVAINFSGTEPARRISRAVDITKWQSSMFATDGLTDLATIGIQIGLTDIVNLQYAQLRNSNWQTEISRIEMAGDHNLSFWK